MGAGIGSLFAGRRIERAAQSIRIASILIIVYGAILIFLSFYSSKAIFSAPSALRFAITALALLPLSFLLGFFFPLGLHLAQHSSKMLAPWAWAVNGFASVAAPPLLTMLAMVSGQRSVIVVSMICYAICGLLVNRQVAKKF
ncbi:hypothetical protein L0152_26325 [bacterium]|nr:hypothetical protein [bacterium]